MKSLGQKITQLQGLVGTKDVTEWQSNFIASIGRQSDGGADTQRLTERQVKIIEEIWAIHFA